MLVTVQLVIISHIQGIPRLSCIKSLRMRLSVRSSTLVIAVITNTESNLLHEVKGDTNYSLIATCKCKCDLDGTINIY